MAAADSAGIPQAALEILEGTEALVLVKILRATRAPPRDVWLVFTSHSL